MTAARYKDTAVEESPTVYAALAKSGGRDRPADKVDTPSDRGQVVVVIGGRDSELVARAVDCGLEPLLASAETLEETIALAVRQAAELDRLRTMTPRIAQVERAKGILMERHRLSERDAHKRIRDHARKLNLKLTAVAEAIEGSYLLFPNEED